jgi:hypothetical protein
MKKTLFLISLTFLTLSGFAQKNDSKTNNTDFGKNIIAFHPLHAVADNFVGVGFSYERLVNNYIGIKVPIMKSINTNYVNVGLEAKLYPARNNGVVKYAIAPSINFGTGDEKYSDYVYDPVLGYNVQTFTKSPRTHFGFLLNQTLNVTIMKQMYIGIDGGLGINYFDDKSNRNFNSNSNNISLAAQFHMALGFRF